MLSIDISLKRPNNERNRNGQRTALPRNNAEGKASLSSSARTCVPRVDRCKGAGSLVPSFGGILYSSARTGLEGGRKIQSGDAPQERQRAHSGRDLSGDQAARENCVYVELGRRPKR